ncbi:hypothetical protein QBC38DRAFT_216653 [Podospora fimiseda]|uniref:Clr5 domain-containing protein n=1 Tax=Podospora fimiseda TaxID=252190 RepID=A0AAN7BNX1_9PEZI|nr:hypothetical protein QBC38DRAFT_216653 [Podospora fimiseda]
MDNTRIENAHHEHKFINDNRTNARRISYETWERLKPTIVKQYKDKTLDEVIEYMKIHEDFAPTRRQYVHRLGKIWGITKYAPKNGNGQANYKRPSPKPPSPTNGERLAPDVKPPRTISAKPNGNTNGQVARRPSPSSFGGRGGNWRLGVPPPSGPPTPEPALTLPPPSPLASDNEPEPEEYEPRLETPEDKEKQRLLAEILLALGDPHYAFTIWVDLHKDDHREEYVINSLRSVQSAKQAKRAHAMIDVHLNQLREKGKKPQIDNEDPDSWEEFLFDIIAARTYDWGVYIGMGLRQIENAILRRVGANDETGREEVNKLSIRPCKPAFDVSVLQFLSFALERYNEPAMQDDEFIDVEEVLRQFESQQPVFAELEADGPATSISSLRECLKWCISVLASDPQPPVSIEYSSDINQRTSQFYLLLLTLWHALHTCSSSPPAWTQDAASQFAISPTQLLGTVTGMILVCSLPSTSPLLSAQSLSTLTDRELLSRFKDRIFSSTIELMNREDEDEAEQEDGSMPSTLSGNLITPSLLNPLRRFAVSTLGIVDNDLPELKEDKTMPDIVCHLVAVHEDLPSGPGKKVQEVKRRRSKRRGGKGKEKEVNGKGKEKDEGDDGVDMMDVDGEEGERGGGGRGGLMPDFD